MITFYVMENNVQFNCGGIKCDNPSCDWEDQEATLEDYKKWIGKGCPKCGENVLTEEDYNNVMLIKKISEQINKIPKDVLHSMNESIDPEAVKESEVFKDAEGLDILDEEADGGAVEISFESKKGKLKSRYINRKK